MKGSTPTSTSTVTPTPERLLREIERAAAQAAAGDLRLPLRLIEPLGPGVDLFVMVAGALDLAIVKAFTVGGRSGSDAGRLAVFAPDGARLGEHDAVAATAQRTAAVSFAAIRRLSPTTPGPAVVVGSGRQACAHLRFLAAVAPGHEVTVCGRDARRAAAVAADAAALGLAATASSDIDAAVARARLVITATDSRTPVIADRVREDALVVAVGNYRATASELPPSLVRRSRLYVDAGAGAQHEAGELLGAGVDWSGVQALDDGRAWTRDPSRPAVFKSVGSAAWDLAWARAAWRP